VRRGAPARIERAEREEGLDRRAGWVGAAQRPVEQRLVRRLVQERASSPCRSLRRTGWGRSRASTRRPARRRSPGRSPPARRGGRRRPPRRLLDPDVQRQRRSLPAIGGGARERAHRAPAGVDLHVLDAGRAVQLALVGELDADLADVVGALVVGSLVPLLDASNVAVVDPPDVADDVRGDLAQRVVPEQPRLDLHAGKSVAVDREAGDLVVGEPRAQRQALEVPRLVEQLAEALAVARLTSTIVASWSIVSSRLLTRDGWISRCTRSSSAPAPRRCGR